MEGPNSWLKSLPEKVIALDGISLALSLCGMVQPSIIAGADCRGRGIMLAACGGGNSVRMKRKLKPTPLQTAPNPDSTSTWLAYPGISNSFCIKTQPQERALVLDRHWRETNRCFHLRRIEYKTYTGAKSIELESDRRWNDKKTILAAAPSSSHAHHFKRTYIDD